MMVNAVLASPYSTQTIQIESDTKTLSKDHITGHIVSYNNNLPSKHPDFKGISLVGRYSRTSEEEINNTASEIMMNRNVRGSVVFALRRKSDGKYIDIDSSTLTRVCNIIKSREIS